MAGLDDFIEFALDIASEVVGSAVESRAEKAANTQQKKQISEGDPGGTPFRGSLDSNGEDIVHVPKSPETTENVTAEEYCQTCIEIKTGPASVIRLTNRNLRDAVVLSELLAPPLSKRKRRI